MIFKGKVIYEWGKNGFECIDREKGDMQLQLDVGNIPAYPSL